MSQALADFEQFMQERAAAALAYVNGDPDPLARLTANTDPATFFSPRGDITQGAQPVTARYASDAAAFAENNENAFEILHMGADDTLAYWVGIQRSDVRLKGKDDMIPFRLRVTEIFRREGDVWKLIHRHADQQPASAEA